MTDIDSLYFDSSLDKNPTGSNFIQYRDEYNREVTTTALNLLQEGYDTETIMRVVPELDRRPYVPKGGGYALDTLNQLIDTSIPTLASLLPASTSKKTPYVGGNLEHMPTIVRDTPAMVETPSVMVSQTSINPLALLLIGFLVLQ